MDLAKVEKMMQLMRNFGMNKLEITEGDQSVKIELTSSAASPAPAMMTGAPVYQNIPQFGANSAQAETPVAAAAAAAAAAPKVEGFEVRSPFVGTFYAASSPGADDFVHVGKQVKKGDTLGIVEAMKLMNEIEAERDGTVSQILVQNEAPVEYDQALFIIS